MKVIVPGTIDLDTTNVAASSEDEWSSGTTYGIGDLVKYTSATPHKVYKSLRENNTAKTPPDYIEPEVIETSSTSSVAIGTGSKTFTVAASLGLVVGMMVTVSHAAMPNSYNMTGEVSSYSGTTLQVNVISDTGTGTFATWQIVTVDTVAFWEVVEATNQYKMFDELVNSQTTNTTSIEVSLTVEDCDAIALFGVDAKEVEVEFWNTGETELQYSETVDLIYDTDIMNAVADWWQYFFGEYTVATEVFVQADDTLYEGVVNVNINQVTGTTAKCGNVVLGKVANLGNTRYGSGIGIVDYSTKETDDDGIISITEGYWAKEHNLDLIIENARITTAYKVLASLRATPTAWIASEEENYELFITYGIYRDFSIVVPGPTISYGSLELEGLV